MIYMYYMLYLFHAFALYLLNCGQKGTIGGKKLIPCRAINKSNDMTEIVNVFAP